MEQEFIEKKGPHFILHFPLKNLAEVLWNFYFNKNPPFKSSGVMEGEKNFFSLMDFRYKAYHYFSHEIH